MEELTAGRNFKYELRHSQRGSWQKYCNDLNTVLESTELMRILSCQIRQIIGSLHRPDGSWTVIGDESLYHLLKVDFPGLQQVSSMADWQFAKIVVTNDVTEYFQGCFRRVLIPSSPRCKKCEYIRPTWLWQSNFHSYSKKEKLHGNEVLQAY